MSLSGVAGADKFTWRRRRNEYGETNMARRWLYRQGVSTWRQDEEGGADEFWHRRVQDKQGEAGGCETNKYLIDYIN